MALKLSVFTTVTDPSRRGDNYRDALKCYSNLVDEVVVVCGGDEMYDDLIKYARNVDLVTIYSDWPKEFSWEFIGQQFQRGYQACTGDWVIHADLDFIFHEKDFEKIMTVLNNYDEAPAVTFYKWQFILPDRYNVKSRLALAINKKRYGERIKFNGGGDLCQPTLDGEDLDIANLPESKAPFYNYEKLIKTEDQIIDDVQRMDNAYLRYFGHPLYSRDDRTAYEGWLKMVLGRFNKPHQRIKLEEHPKYVQDTIKNLTPEQFGYNAFGNLEVNDYVS